MKENILVVGSGMAGLTCAKILADCGWNVSICDSQSSSSFLPLPMLIINNMTCDLFQKIWNLDDIFKKSHILNKRKIIWGQKRTISIIPQESKVISGKIIQQHLSKILDIKYDSKIQKLNRTFINRLIDPESQQQIMNEFRWIIDATGRRFYLAKIFNSMRKSFGHRCIHSTIVTVSAKSIDQNMCIIESIFNGWIFLVPIGESMALLQIMIPRKLSNNILDISNLLKQTTMIGSLISNIPPNSIFLFDAFPQISLPLCGNNWICVGDSAVSFDPISGEGTGYGLRGAILAAGVINGIESGLSMNDCLNHYSLRLKKVFYSHIRECLRYYSDNYFSLEWMDEIKFMKYEFSKMNISELPKDFKLRLNGFSLERFN